MSNIMTITDKDFGLDIVELNNPRIRIGARGLVFNSNNKIAILNKRNKNEYKLVGGGVEVDEEPKTAFKREVLEETGCKVEIDDFIGTIREERTHNNFVQISHLYVAHVIEDTKIFNLTEKEITEGAQLLWLNLDEAINIIKDCERKIKSSKYEDIYLKRFVVRRDYNILEFYKNNYLKNNK